MYKIVKILGYSFLSIVIIGSFIFYNLGYFLDVTSKPVKSDIIVCLGGGDKGRIKKAITLYEQGYSLSNLLILTGDDRSKKRKLLNMDDKRVQYLKDADKYADVKIVHYKAIGNTKVEILFIKKYMIENDFKTAMIVSDVPHSRRIDTLLNLIDVDGDEKLQFNIVGSDASWWDSNHYYETKRAQVFAIHESIKIVYTYVAFGFLDKVGLFEITREVMKPSYKVMKKKIAKTLSFYLKEKKQVTLVNIF